MPLPYLQIKLRTGVPVRVILGDATYFSLKLQKLKWLVKVAKFKIRKEFVILMGGMAPNLVMIVVLGKFS